MDQMCKFYENVYIHVDVFQYENWRCISEINCSRKITYYNAETIDQERPYKIFKSKCLEHCPPETEEYQYGNKWTCKVDVFSKKNNS